VFRVGGAAKQWAESSVGIAARDRESDDHRVTAAADMAEAHAAPAGIPVAAEQESAETPSAATAVAGSIGSDVVVDGVSVLDMFDDRAGIGVCGEHRGAGTGVKAISHAGAGLAAYSTEFEAVHAETRSMDTAAVAAYNLNPRGGGAAIFAKKEGPRGHAGFFDGRVWITGELGVGGDIVLANADCAEDFDVVSASSAAPGTVMVASERGVLHPSSQAYDRRVVGVISGAGQYRPGLVLDKQPSETNRSPVALLGKVCCKATAEFGAIAVGDLLTTSPTTGHAMKASDPARAFGAVIGKALSPLQEGQGLIPILVALL
jgi:hypothetical protein